jgi:hypothetical protein
MPSSDTQARPDRGRAAYVPWGMLAAIDLHRADGSRLADPGSIRAFVPAVIAAIDVFSCRPFDADLAATIAVDHFGGQPSVTVLQR